MATKKAKVEVVEENNKFKKLFELTPCFYQSEFERKNFGEHSSVSYPRYIIETVNRIRKIDSDLETEKRTFERTVLLEEKQQLENFLNKEDLTKLEVSVATWEETEDDYWIDLLGKIAAVEIITVGKPSLETMSKMVKLPEEAYIKSTQLCVKVANAIKEATVRAEEEVGIYGSNSNDINAPRKLMLKKVK